MKIFAAVILMLTVMTSHAGDSKQRLIRLPGGRVEPITVESVSGYDVIEGDVLVAKRQAPSAAVIIDAEGSRWKEGVVPFMIDSNISDENLHNIYRAMIEISYDSSVHFVERQSDQADYLYFTPSSGTICASHVGRKGGRQDIVLSPRCKKGSTMHEILHALGFWHEQSRGDRDSYIDIIWGNIKAGKSHNFIRHDSDGLDKGDYDYDSIMHYGAKAFSKNGNDTIVPLAPNKRIGQREVLSEKDIKALKALY